MRQFGGVRFFGFERRVKSKDAIIGFIEFDAENVSAANELISKGYIIIDDKRLHVSSFEEYKRRFRHAWAKVLEPTNIVDLLLQTPEQNSPMHILNKLNDDCIEHIFRKLHFSTLNVVARVCIRFNQIAKNVFELKYQSQRINILDLEWNREPTLVKIENFLSEFGATISSLSFAYTSVYEYESDRLYCGIIKDANVQLKMINKYCKHLNELEFNFADIVDQTLYECRTLFKRLIRLRMESVGNGAIFDILAVCGELETLYVHIEYAGQTFDLPKIALPKLVAVRFLWMPKGGNPTPCPTLYAGIVRFLELNTKLKILQIAEDFHSVMDVISRLGELNKFRINFIRPVQTFVEKVNANNMHDVNFELDIGHQITRIQDINHYSMLRNVTVFSLAVSSYYPPHRINNDYLEFFLKSLPHIQCLHLKLSEPNNLDEISTSKVIVIKKILQHANHLRKLSFSIGRYPSRYFRQYPIDEENYYEILNLVHCRNRGIKLTIEFNIDIIGSTKMVNESRSVYCLDMVPESLVIMFRTKSQRRVY